MRFKEIFLIITLFFITTDGVQAANIDSSRDAVNQLKMYLESDDESLLPIYEYEFSIIPLTREDAQLAKKLLWNDYVRYIQATRSAEMRARTLTVDNHVMPFFYTVSGKPPRNGRSLYISLHGGGGKSKQDNDIQWENQKNLYSIPEGIYIAPRAPTDVWDMWHQDHIDVLLNRIIENFIVFENANPNRVYLLGYSAGGDGVYQLAPRMADHWAAASMMAGHPNGASPVNLYNTPFTIHVGAKDGGYDRNKVAAEWGQKLDELHRAFPEGYTYWTKIYEGKGHWIDGGAPDALPWMSQFVRNPLPKDIIWEQNKQKRFYWLAAENLALEGTVRAVLNGQQIELWPNNIADLAIRMNDDMLNLDKPIRVVIDDAEIFHGRVKRTISTLASTLYERGDPTSMFSGEIVLDD